MKLYLTHPSNYDYQTELYEPLKQSIGPKHDIVYPHDTHTAGVNSKDIIPSCDVVLAEVSILSTGQGIELGWASAAGKPIICFYRRSATVSGSLRFITNDLFDYASTTDMLTQLTAALEATEASLAL